jgi:hypothetical protein
MEVTTGTVGDTTQLGALLESLDDIESVSGDTGYLSHRNCELIEAKGATPYLKPRRHSPEKPIGPPAWKRMKVRVMLRRYRNHRLCSAVRAWNWSNEFPTQELCK